MFKISAWNNYNEIDGSGDLIIGREIQAQTPSQALDIAEKEARAWNFRHRSASNSHLRVNVLTCNGYVRLV